MKIHQTAAIKNFTKLKPTANTAYSALFSLSLLSTIAAGGSLSKDTYAPQNETTLELTNLKQSPVIKAQSIYKDNFGHQWVRYQDYKKKYAEYLEYKDDIERYETKISLEQDEINEYGKKIQEMTEFINEAQEILPQAQAKTRELEQIQENVDDFYSLIKDSELEAGFLGAAAGVILALISRGLFNFYNNHIRRKK